MTERLHKWLARAGVASRRAAEAMIQQGRVTVNGQLAQVGQPVASDDEVRLDGRLLQLEAVEPITYALYKPVGYVCSAQDEFGRRTVLDAMPPIPGLHSVGRLDRDSEGLLLLTTDGELTLQLTHPRYRHQKAYRVWTQEGTPGPAELERLKTGVMLDDGPAQVLSAEPAQDGAFVILQEGRKRQVRRMFAALGYEVGRLLRYRLGGLWLSELGLAPGEYQPLTQRQLAELLDPQRLSRERWHNAWEATQRRWG